MKQQHSSKDSSNSHHLRASSTAERYARLAAKESRPEIKRVLLRRAKDHRSLAGLLKRRGK